jgi:hypothetical protein
MIMLPSEALDHLDQIGPLGVGQPILLRCERVEGRQAGSGLENFPRGRLDGSITKAR